MMRDVALPTVTAEKALEGKSRAIFCEEVAPWLVTDWTQHDYGIDAIVEVTQPRESCGDFDATGRRFAVQLKATEETFDGKPTVSVRVRPGQVRYWLESTEPVLLVLCRVGTRQLLWRWVDHSVIEELNRRDPAWIGQETVSVSLPTAQVLDAPARRSIAVFATEFRRSARRILAPGAFMDVHARLSSIASSLTAHARDAGFQSVVRRLADLEAAVRASTYVVVLTGPARAGKSTLLNALVGREISPVGRLPTTAVSLMVVAGARDEAEVTLADGSRLCGEASAAFLARYATQEHNPDNCKGVRVIAVRLVSGLLERGVAYADAPGLHDPSEEIRAVTESALTAAHAVMYVLDTSPAKHGGFALSSYQLDDLKRLRGMAERLFVVLNKSDVLAADERSEVASYVERTLRKYSLWDSLPVPPLFVSASAGWAWHQTGRSGVSPISVLDEAIWGHLLKTNSTGIDRLTAAATELRRAGGDFASLLASRRMSGSEAFRLRTALAVCRASEREIVARCRHRKGLDCRFVTKQLRGERESLLGRLKSTLEAVPVEQPLPTTTEIEQDLQAHVTKVLRDVWGEASGRFQFFAATVHQEVEKSLQQARLATGAREHDTFLLPQVPTLNVEADSFEEAWTGLFTGGLFGFLLGGPWTLALAAGGWLVGLLLGEKPKRARDIGRIVERAGASLTTALRVVQQQMHERIRIYFEHLEHHVSDRITVFVHDAESQLHHLGMPIGPAEARRLEQQEEAVQAALVALQDAYRQLSPGSEQHVDVRSTPESGASSLVPVSGRRKNA